MGIYSYGIREVGQLDEGVKVSRIRFRFKRHLGADSEVLAKEERLDNNYIARWEGRQFPRLVDHEGQLRVWLTNLPIADDHDWLYGCAPLNAKSWERLPEDERNALPSWVLTAIELVDRNLISVVPSSKSDFFNLIKENN